MNVERAKRGERPLTLRGLARATGVAPSVLTTLAAEKSQRIDYGTIDRVLAFIHGYFPVNTNDLIPWAPDQASEAGEQLPNAEQGAAQ
jgi:DNA-binding Xre family transcriptional regulator